MRLLPGQSEKIDRINELVLLAKSGDGNAMASLLEIFHPLILGICRKWSVYFNDESHQLKPLSDLISDTQYWMWWYTVNKYTVDGEATYNNFIRKHLTQRVRYMFEEQINYNKKLVMPDPDKHNTSTGDKEMFDDVVFNYSSNHNNQDTLDILIDGERTEYIQRIADSVMSTASKYLSERERMLFSECILHGKTHTSVARQLGISRTRVSQVIGKVKTKIRMHIDPIEEDVI